MLREVAEQNGCVLARKQARRNATRGVGHRDAAGGTAHGLRQRNPLALGNRLRYLREHVGNGCGRDDCLAHDRHQEVVIHAMNQVELQLPPRRLPQAMGDERMVLAQRGSDHKRPVERVQLRDRHAQPWRPGALGVHAEIRLAQPEVRVARGKFARELAQQEQLLERLVGRRQRPDACGTVPIAYAPQLAGDEIERDLPLDLLPGAAPLQHGPGKTLLGIEALVGEAVLVRKPALVDGLVLAGQYAHHAVLLDLHGQVGAQPAMRAHRGPAGEFPRARRVAEGLGGERPDGAQIDHVARQLRVHRFADESDDLRVLAAADHAQLHDARDLLPEAHAARAMDAARHVGGDERAQVLLGHHALRLLVARAARPVADREVLQLAFAALVADRAVERVIDEQEFHDAVLRGDRLLRVRPHLHAVGRGRGAGGQRLRRLLHLHQAHATVRGDGKLAVITEMGDIDARLVRGVHDRRAVGNLHALAVQFQLDQLASVSGHGSPVTHR